jgi:predicted DNA-binding mobile mystery protein A
MSTPLNRLKLEQTDRALAVFAPLSGKPVPRGGWLRAVRESLGLSLRAQAARVGVTAPSLFKAEASEAEGRITLGQLRKLAEGLDCEVVYALVPRRPLGEVVEAQADKLAREAVLGVAHSMALEEQRPSNAFVDQLIEDRRRALLAGSWAKLWR